MTTGGKACCRHYQGAAVETNGRENGAIPENQLSEENRLLTMAEADAGIGHWRIDLITGEVFWSPTLYAMVGLAPDRALTRDELAAFFLPDDRPIVDAAGDKVEETGILEPTRLRMIRADGRIIYVVTSGRMDGQNSMFGIMREVTQEVEAERGLILARDQARAAERAYADFIAVISNEIRTPMTGILATIDLLRADSADGQRSHLLESLSQSACTLTAVLDDMLDLSRVGTGRMVLESRPFDLKALIKTTADLFQSTAQNKSLHLDVHGLDGAPAIVHGDSARVQQIFSNLIGNAIKYTEAGRISITASISRSEPGTDYWMVVVQDSGIGIGQEALGRIFSRYEQVDAARARLEGRSGLGLAISQQLAEAMGGSIAVSSDPGRGSTFSIELPFAIGTGVVAAGQQADGQPLGPLRILLAEDNPVNRRLMSALLSRQGHEVVAVEDGLKALNATTGQQFDLILMDMQMPELDGLAATRAIRALDPPASQTPILAISADAQPERRRAYFEAGVDSFLPKPIVSGQLLEMVDKMRRGAISQAEQPADRFNRERLNWLVEQAGFEEAGVLMKMLLFDVTDRPVRITAAIRATAWDLAAAEAEALRTLLDTFGNFALSRLLASIARQCGQRACPAAIITDMVAQAAELSTFLQHEIGGMPKPIARAIDNVVETDFTPRSQEG
jgi:signal transduction histidine kinase/DNA-binding response OmpR family regulator